MHFTNTRFAACIALACAAAVQAGSIPADPLTVRQLEGQLHGFLVLRSPDGAIIADGDLIQTTHGSQIHSRLVFHFKDGSLQDETAIFSQRGRFRLLSDHLIQKGPSFNRAMDVLINAGTGLVTVHSTDDKGKDKTIAEHLDLPPDLANGMVPILLKNVTPGAQTATYSMVVATPKPVLVKLQISSGGEDQFSTGGEGRKATRYIVKVDLGAVKGAVASLVGKQPPDTFVWILAGACPVFVRSEGPMYESGPIWRIEPVSPAWPKK